MRILKIVLLIAAVAVVGARDVQASLRPPRAPLGEPAGIAVLGVALLTGAHAIRKRLTQRG